MTVVKHPLPSKGLAWSGSSSGQLRTTSAHLDVNGISVFKDFGERNDVFIAGVLTMKAIGKQEETIKVKTDVHKFARKFASFNYLWTFKITAPVQHCCLELSLLDDDRFISDDMIYLPKKLALESFMDFAYKHVKDDGMSSSSVKHLIVFDQTPREAPTCCDSCIKGTEKNQYIVPTF